MSFHFYHYPAGSEDYDPADEGDDDMRCVGKQGFGFLSMAVEASSQRDLKFAYLSASRLRSQQAFVDWLNCLDSYGLKHESQDRLTKFASGSTVEFRSAEDEEQEVRPQLKPHEKALLNALR